MQELSHAACIQIPERETDLGLQLESGGNLMIRALLGFTNIGAPRGKQ